MIHVVVALSYILAFIAVDFVIQPLQESALGEHYVASVIFLPHGVRVLCAVLVGWRGVPALWAAHVACFYFLWRPGEDFGLLSVLAITGVSALSAQVVWSAMSIAGLARAGENKLAANWRIVIFLGAAASLLNSLGVVAAFNLIRPGFLGADALHSVGLFALGDTVGVVALLFLLVGLRRAYRLWRLA